MIGMLTSNEDSSTNLASSACTVDPEERPGVVACDQKPVSSREEHGFADGERVTSRPSAPPIRCVGAPRGALPAGITVMLPEC